MKRLMLGVATAGLVITTAHAQAPFADVPRDHWAYDAVNTMSQRGLIIGYPDGTFGGKRAMTRYEFAVVIARILPRLDEFIRDEVELATGNVVTAMTPPPVTNDPDLSGYVTRSDFETLRRLVDQFALELQMLQVDVANIRRDLDDLRNRVGIVEKQLDRVQVSGELNVISRHSAIDGDDLRANQIPLDLDGRTLNPTNNLLEHTQILYDMDLGLRFKATDTITANALLNIGNYLGGFAGGTLLSPTPYPFPYGDSMTNSSNADITPWKAYIEAPVSLGPLGVVSVEAGKTGVQFTPYTLKLVDYDSYTNLTKTDNGEVIFTGLKGNFRIGGVGVMAYGGTHARQPNASGFPLYITANYTPSPQNAYLHQELALFPGIPVTVAELDQSAGIHATLGTPLNGSLGLTFIQAGITNGFANNGAVPVRRGQVYGADLALDLTRNIGFAGEWAFSQVRQETELKLSQDTVYPRDLSSAYDARLAFALGNLNLTAGYRQVDPFFGAPGYWGAIGSWKNPTNIRGLATSAEYAFGNRMALVGSYDNYRSVVEGVGAGAMETSGDTKLQHYKAGLRFGLTSANRVDLGVEHVVYTDLANAALRSANGDAKETYYNIGLGSQLSENTSLKLLYQIIDLENHFLTNNDDANGGVAVAQFQVKF